MATQIYCDPCSGDNKYLPAIRYCSDCEEHLCKECAEYHSRFKAFKLHHLIDLASTGNKIPSSTKKYCEIHPDTLLDFYCTQHDTSCCKDCIPINHRGCEKVLSLERASKDVRNSALFSDTIADIRHFVEIVQQLLENRDANLKSLSQTKSFVKHRISTVKSRLLREIEDFEQKLVTQLSTLEEKHTIRIQAQKSEITKLESDLTNNKRELDFLKEHGSESHLFLALRQFVTDNDIIENDIKRLVSSVKDISIKFDEVRELSIQNFGSINEVTKPCTVEYKSRKVSHAQMIHDVIKPLTKFEKIGQLKLKSGEDYNITDMAVTTDNKLLISNNDYSYPKVYIYKDCKDYEGEITCSNRPYGITIIPDTDTAVVTLPYGNSIQFINTSNMTKGNKVKVGFQCWGISATKDNIFVGGYRVVHMLDIHGTKITEVTGGGSDINSVYYNKVNDRLLCRYFDGMRCVTLDGKPVYQYSVSGETGLAVDQQEHVYLSHQQNEVHRLTSDGKLRDVVLTKDHGITNPYALTFNKDFTKLCVVNNLDSVTVFYCQ